MDNPYETPSADVGSNTYTYAGFWIRTAAMLIDTLIMMAIIGPILFSVYGSAAFLGTEDLGITVTLINYALPAIASILFWVYKSATPGKMICDIRIIDEKTGQNPKVGQSIIRYIGYYVSSILLFIGFIWVAFDSKKQGWHDKMSGTVVIKK